MSDLPQYTDTPQFSARRCVHDVCITMLLDLLCSPILRNGAESVSICKESKEVDTDTHIQCHVYCDHADA